MLEVETIAGSVLIPSVCNVLVHGNRDVPGAHSGAAANAGSAPRLPSQSYRNTKPLLVTTTSILPWQHAV